MMGPIAPETTVTPLDPTVPVQPIKGGVYTSEFWLAVGAILSALAVQFGFVNAKDQSGMATGWSQAVAAMFTLLAQAGTAIGYLYSRYKLKTAHLNAEVAVVQAVAKDSPKDVPLTLKG